jgi:hypothetical protein
MHFSQRTSKALTLQNRCDESCIKRHTVPLSPARNLPNPIPSRILFAALFCTGTRTDNRQSLVNSEALLEAGFEETSELGCCAKLRNRVQVFKRRRERVRQTPHRARVEFIVLGIVSAHLMNAAVDDDRVG